MPCDYDVLIVGGGLAGFTTMLEILKAAPELRVCLVEARGRYGGRTRTVSDPLDDKHLDLGGTWVGPQQTFVLAAMEELGVRTYKQYLEGAHIHDDGSSVNRYSGTIPALPVWTLLDTHFLLRRLNRMAAQVTVGSPEACRFAAKWDGTSLADFGRLQCWTRQGQSMLGVVCRLIFGVEAGQISLLYFLHYVAAAGGLEPLMDSENGAQDSRIEGGSVQLILNMKSRIEAIAGDGCSFLQASQVVAITADTPVAPSAASPGADISLSLSLHNGTVITGRRVVCCCPPSCLARMAFSPPAPAWKMSLWQRSHAGCWTKVIVRYATPFWRLAGFSGTVACEHPSRDRPISCVMDYCDPDGGRAALVCFVVGDNAVDFASLGEAQQRASTTSHLARLFGQDAGAEHVIGFHVTDWLHDPDALRLGSGGCPVDIAAMGFFAKHGRLLSQPLALQSQRRGHDVRDTSARRTDGEENDDDDHGSSLARPLLAPAAAADTDESSGHPASRAVDLHFECVGANGAAAPSLRCVFFAGTETATRWIGYMDGAIESGQRAAAEVVASLQVGN